MATRAVSANPNLVVAPAPEERAAVRSEPLSCADGTCPLWAVMGAHGGAAASTLARWWPEAVDSDGAWPACPDTTQLVVIAARACMPGLAAAALRLREWHSQLAPPGVLVVGLVLSAARPGRLPEPVRRFRELVAPLVGGTVYQIGWHEELVSLELSDLAPCGAGAAVSSRRHRPVLTGAGPRDAVDAADRITQSIRDLRGSGLLRQS